MLEALCLLTIMFWAAARPSALGQWTYRSAKKDWELMFGVGESSGGWLDLNLLWVDSQVATRLAHDICSPLISQLSKETKCEHLVP
jgi:hypothetical protein